MSVSNNRPNESALAASGEQTPEASASDDQQMIERALLGDVEAFDQLVGCYAPRLLRMAYALVGNREDAEDLAQEALSKAYFKLDSFAGRSSFFTWLYRITVNLSISKRRKRRLESTHHAVTLDDAPPPATEQTADQTLDTQEQIDRMRAAIEQLEEDRRTVLVLRDIEGLDYSEIANVLDIPKGTVRSRLHRARGDLKERMQHDHGPPVQPSSTTAAPASARHTKTTSQPHRNEESNDA
ncbi:RNA polymerase sigma factor [Roseimaritima ulvae]|uniref:ECF RNA polymerase sigma factor SigW n=1 Tax=Roseimaritima ulvae TaxID=980254 RepID=A0A5B9QKL6_9BACT|nr:sigma-70 family RNA polymerase sigma factor [Roseimaritima ulvae]QEG39434.1 ECF RNA polymerase sigma factor SigW [Roseimaritima ulvae]